MSISGIQGQPLEITVVGCTKLKNTEWISRQDPYVCLEYANSKFRTRTCKDGGKNPTFQEKFVLSLVEGLREVSVVVWNSNTLTYDDLIGKGKIQLQKALSHGYDDSAWALQDKRGRHAGEVRLIMHYANANRPTISHAPSAPSYAGTPGPQVPLYSAPPPIASYPPISMPAPLPYPSYPPSPVGYPPLPHHQPVTYPPTYPPGQPPSVYPPHSTYPPGQPPSVYPPHSTYPPEQPPSVYPPHSTYPPGQPPSVYPPHSTYPPPPLNSNYYPPGSYPYTPPQF